MKRRTFEMANSKGINFGVAVALGAAMGAGIGAATHNMGVAVAIGVALGAAFGIVLQGGAVRKQKDDSTQLRPPESGPR
jgi:hypothetical protein